MLRTVQAQTLQVRARRQTADVHCPAIQSGVHRELSEIFVQTDLIQTFPHDPDVQYLNLRGVCNLRHGIQPVVRIHTGNPAFRRKFQHGKPDRIPRVNPRQPCKSRIVGGPAHLPRAVMPAFHRLLKFLLPGTFPVVRKAVPDRVKQFAALPLITAPQIADTVKLFRCDLPIFFPKNILTERRQKITAVIRRNILI